MKKIVLTGGGTAGHVTPNIALIPTLQEKGYEVHYIILRASKEETLNRATGRLKLDSETNTELVEVMWEQFHHLGVYERNAIDTTNDSIQDTVSAINEKISNKTALLL